MLGFQCGADGSNPSLLQQPAGGSLLPASNETIESKGHYLKMNGREIFKSAVRVMERAALELLERHGIDKNEVSHVIPHQANARIVESLSQRLEIPMERFYCNLHKYGNTSAASIPLALDEAYSESETSEDPRLLPAIATEIEAYDDPKQISPGYSTSEGEDEACRLGCGDLSPYSTSEDEDHAAPLRGRGPLPSYRPSKLTRRSKALGARRRGKTVAFASEPLSVAILTPVSAVKPQRVAFSPVAPAEVLELSSVEVLPPRRWRRGPLFVLAVVLGALFANGLKTTKPATVSMVRKQPTPIGLSLTTPLRPGRARLSRVPEPTPFPEPTADAVPLVVLAAATGAAAAMSAPPAVRLVPRAARVLVTALR